MKPICVVLTGAGISAESGIPTFRAEDGLWAGHKVEEVCTPEALLKNRAKVILWIVLAIRNWKIKIQMGIQCVHILFFSVKWCRC